MELALLFLESTSNNQEKEKAVQLFETSGYKVGGITELVKSNEWDFRETFTVLMSNSENLVVFDDGCQKYDTKNIIAEILECQIEVNESAKEFALAVANDKNREYSDDFAKMPEDATVIANINGLSQGFMLDKDSFSLFYLPSVYAEYKAMCDNVIKKIDEKHDQKKKRIVLKYFGSIEALKKTINRAEEIASIDFSCEVTIKNGDCTIGLTFDNYNETDSATIIRFIVSELKDDIYAESDESLSERLFDILKLKRLRLAVAESFTGGRVVADVIKNSGASEVVIEGLVSYSDESKVKLLGVKKESLQSYGAVSSTVACEMAMGLLNTTACDVAIATTGLAGPNSDASGKPVGLCYIAIGMRDGVYTYRFNFKGDRENITETAKNTALYLAIKNIKKHNF